MTEDEFSFWTSFDNYIEGRNRSSLDQNDVQLQLDNYFKETYLSRKKNPLIYWKKNAKQYFILAELVKKYVCIMASIVPVERVFSKAGELVSKKRNRLKDNKVKKILFLNNIV